MYRTDSHSEVHTRSRLSPARPKSLPGSLPLLGPVEALQTARRSQPVISEWVFPAPSDPAKPISRHLVRNWWERGQELANLPAEPGRGWHSLRRQLPRMKHAPLKDLCALGGWKSPQTVLTCYQRADAVSMQQALAPGAGSKPEYQRTTQRTR